jgi:hypothetical protein
MKLPIYMILQYAKQIGTAVYQWGEVGGKLFRPVSQRVQMHFISNDNVRILCLSCNVKKVGKLVRFKQKGQKQASFLTNMLYEYIFALFVLDEYTFQPTNKLSWYPVAMCSRGRRQV